MCDQSAEHVSYLLRLWRAGHEEGGSDHWRASLEEIGAGERHAFLSLEALFAFLDAQSRAPNPTRDRPPMPTGEEQPMG
jgi:hypothetical protein